MKEKTLHTVEKSKPVPKGTAAKAWKGKEDALLLPFQVGLFGDYLTPTDSTISADTPAALRISNKNHFVKIFFNIKFLTKVNQRV